VGADEKGGILHLSQGTGTITDHEKELILPERMTLLTRVKLYISQRSEARNILCGSYINRILVVRLVESNQYRVV
jgi:hypothetical protein